MDKTIFSTLLFNFFRSNLQCSQLRITERRFVLVDFVLFRVDVVAVSFDIAHRVWLESVSWGSERIDMDRLLLEGGLIAESHCENGGNNCNLD